MNFLGGLWVSFPENRPDNGTGWSQATYQFTPTGGYQLHSSTSHSPNEAVQPSSLTNHTLPPLNTILNTDSPSSSFSSSLLIPRLRRHRSHNQENQRGRNVHSHDFHLVRTPLRRGTSRLSLSREHTPVSRPASIGSWNSEEASVTTLPSWPSQVQESFIDLTADSSPVVMLSGSRKRSAVESRITDDASALCSKRLKVESRPLAETLKNTAELDLRDVEDNEGLARVFEEQRIASVKAQQAEANKPVSFSNLQCVICMEPMTNITVTHCGKLSGRLTPSVGNFTNPTVT